MKSLGRFLSIFIIAVMLTASFSEIFAAFYELEAADLSYEDKLFDHSYVHEMNVEISEADWSDLLKNPTQKTKYQVNVTIDGEVINDVSFATKGNSSLSTLASSKSNKYSFKINFGYYVDGQKYNGLKKLSLNNMYIDATCMKDYICYEIMKAAGVESPLTSYCILKINGEIFGLYLAIEEEGKSYLKRTGNEDGAIYKPEITNDGFNTGGGGNRGGSGGGRGTSSSSDDPVYLKYIDDEISSYPNIFDNAEVTVTEEQELKVIAALKALSEGNIESALNVDEILRYFAAHNFVVNKDSYTGNRGHNYYLLENNGLLSMLPWDYNEAFGAHGLSNNSEVNTVINWGIDSPLDNCSEADRPMWTWITGNEQYLNQYHEIFSGLLSDYFESGLCAEEIDRVHDLIRSYVEEDPNSFYTAEEFDTACESLKLFCSLRSESIRKQLDGTLAAITKEQNKADMVDASALNLLSMGVQGR